MAKILLLVIVISASLTASAGVTLIKYQPANGDCGVIERSAAQLITQAGTDQEIIAGRVTSAINFLNSIRSPKVEDTQAILPAMKTNPEGNLDKYFLITVSDCSEARAKLGHAFINSASGNRVSPTEKAALTTAIKEDLKRNRYPTYSESKALAETLNLGVTKSLFKLSTNDTTALANLIQALTAKILEMTPKLDAAATAAGEQVPYPAKLKANKKFQAVKRVYAIETEDSIKYLEELHTLIERL